MQLIAFPVSAVPSAARASSTSLFAPFSCLFFEPAFFNTSTPTALSPCGASFVSTSCLFKVIEFPIPTIWLASAFNHPKAERRGEKEPRLLHCILAFLICTLWFRASVAALLHLELMGWAGLIIILGRWSWLAGLEVLGLQGEKGKNQLAARLIGWQDVLWELATCHVRVSLVSQPADRWATKDGRFDELLRDQKCVRVNVRAASY